MAAELPLALLAAALTYALHSTAILGLTWLSLRVGGLAPLVRARAWRMALVGGLLTATVQLAAGVRPLGGTLDLTASVEAARSAGADRAAGPREAPTEVPIDLARALRVAELPAVVLDAEPTAASRTELEPAAQADPWKRALSWAWSFGAAYGVALVALRHRRFRAGVRDRLPVWDARAERLLADLTRRAGVERAIRLTRSRALRVPATWGWRRPEICLPDRALRELADDELEAVLAHELGHVVRGDAFWLTLGQVLQALCFFQPLNRVARRGLARESEHLADAFAVDLTNRPVSLAKSLARVATWLDPRAASAEPAVATMAASRSALLERVERVLETRRRRERTLAPSLCVLAAPFACIPLLPGVASKVAEDRSGAADRPVALTAEHDAVATSTIPIRDGLELLSPGEAVPPLAGVGPATIDPARALAAVLDELDVLRAQLERLGLHPRAAAHSATLDSLKRRIARLESLATRATAFIAPIPGAPIEPGDASAGPSDPTVPPRPTPNVENRR